MFYCSFKASGAEQVGRNGGPATAAQRKWVLMGLMRVCVCEGKWAGAQACNLVCERSELGWVGRMCHSAGGLVSSAHSL